MCSFYSSGMALFFVLKEFIAAIFSSLLTGVIAVYPITTVPIYALVRMAGVDDLDLIAPIVFTELPPGMFDLLQAF